MSNVIIRIKNEIKRTFTLFRQGYYGFLWPVGGWGATYFKTAHDTATKITQNIVPTISSIYALFDWRNDVSLRHNYVIYLNLLAESKFHDFFFSTEKCFTNG